MNMITFMFSIEFKAPEKEIGSVLRHDQLNDSTLLKNIVSKIPIPLNGSLRNHTSCVFGHDKINSPSLLKGFL